MSAKWIPPLLISSFSWGTSDTICDVIIGDHDHAKPLPTTKSDMELTSISTTDEDADEKYHKGDKTKKKAPSAKLDTEEVSLSMEVDADDKYNKEKAKRHLTRNSTSSYQTVFIAVVIDYIALFIYFLGLYIFYDQYRAYVGKSSFIFKEHYDAPFYMALASGAFSYLAFHFMMRAWETSSSTIILPLLQFPSIFVFFACGIPKMWFGEVWIESYWHILAYVILFFGGLLPATDGKPQKCFKKEFWTQPVVKMAIGSEMCHGIYNILISSGEHSMSHDDPNVHWFVKHFEFFAVTRIAYIIACCVFLCFDKKYREEVVALKWVAKRPLYGAYGANSLGFVGYIASSRAYQLHSQTGVVTAAESALNQMLNLFSAFALKKFFRLGSDESLKGMRVKVISAFIIAFGLYMGS